MLVLAYALLAMYEIALVSGSKSLLKSLADKGRKRAATVLGIAAAPENMLYTIRLWTTVIAIVLGIHSVLAFHLDLSQLWGMSLSIAGAAVVIVALVVVALTVLGDAVPKFVGLNYPEVLAMTLTPLMRIVAGVSFPLVWLLKMTSKLICKILGIKTSDTKTMSEDEIKLILKQGSEQGVIEPQETNMIKEVFRFSDTSAGELMTHRTELVSLYTDQTKDEVLDVISSEQYSRYLLCDESSEDVLGVVSVKDIIGLWREGEAFDLRRIVAQPVFIKEDTLAHKVLEIFKQKKSSFAVVVNEYGAIEGVITLHDITESILGDIPEENDEPEEASIFEREDGSMLVDGTCPLDEFMERMGIYDYEDLEEGNFNTLSGMAMFLLDEFPKTGDRFVYRNLGFEVVDMDGNRVDKLLVRPIRPDDQEE